MKKLLSPFLVLALCIFNSCTNNASTMNDEVAKTLTPSYDVYVAGKENNKASYWKNTLKTELTNGEDITPLEIIVQSNNVYVTGTKGATPTSLKPIHFFWKNGTRYEIKQYLNLPSTGLSDITAFTVYEGNVYFAGYVENPNAVNPLEKYELCYWKNDSKNILYKSQYIPSAEGITAANSVTGTEVYVSATVPDNNQNVSRGYFKNTTFNAIPAANYVFNFAKNNNGIQLLYQKNSKFYSKNVNTNLETLIGDYSNTLPFYGKITTDTGTNDLYTTYYNQGSTYYKNTNTVTPGFSSLPNIQDIFALNNNVYMIKYNSPSTTYTGKVYVNGVEAQTITSTQNSSQNFTGTFNAVYVVEN